MRKGYMRSGEIYEVWKIHIENGNTRRWNIYGMETNTETEHIQREDIYKVETYMEKKYRTYIEKGQIEWRYTWKVGTHGKGI